MVVAPYHSTLLNQLTGNIFNSGWYCKEKPRCLEYDIHGMPMLPMYWEKRIIKAMVLQAEINTNICQDVLRNMRETMGGSKLWRGVQFPNGTPGASTYSCSNFTHWNAFINWQIFHYAWYCGFFNTGQNICEVKHIFKCHHYFIGKTIWWNISQLIIATGSKQTKLQYKVNHKWIK